MAVSNRVPCPVEAKRYLSGKAIVETEDWDDLKWGEHAHAFTVAHSRNAGVLDDIFGLLNRALAEGESFTTFRDGLRDMMEMKGWYGRQDKGPDDEDYIAWRTRLIFHTNMRTAYSAGHYRQELRIADLRPIWEYVSQLVGDSRRPEHVALHGKAFRYDDPFWDKNYPPNGWGCECEVLSKSEAEAEREGLEILSSDKDGNPPTVTGDDGSPVDWDKFTGKTWAYNPGREALAPNFRAYTNLSSYRMADGRTALAHVTERYRRDMEGTRLARGEFDTLMRRINKADYAQQDIMYQVGNLGEKQHKAMINAGVDDSKIMAADRALFHGSAAKNADQKLRDEHVKEIFDLIQNPPEIYEEISGGRRTAGRTFFFVGKARDGERIKIVLRQLSAGVALRIVTMGRTTVNYKGKGFKKIW